jgi:hypothetical protein
LGDPVCVRFPQMPNSRRGSSGAVTWSARRMPRSP